MSRLGMEPLQKQPCSLQPATLQPTVLQPPALQPATLQPLHSMTPLINSDFGTKQHVSVCCDEPVLEGSSRKTVLQSALQPAALQPTSLQPTASQPSSFAATKFNDPIDKFIFWHSRCFIGGEGGFYSSGFGTKKHNPSPASLWGLTLPKHPCWGLAPAGDSGRPTPVRLKIDA